MVELIAAFMPWVTALFLILLILWQVRQEFVNRGKASVEKKQREEGERAQQREATARRGKRGMDLLDDVSRMRRGTSRR